MCIGNCAKKHGMEHTDNWYEHVPPVIKETESMALKWDCTIYTNNKLKHNRPDITLVNKESNEWILIDTAVPFDRNILRIEGEKINRYQDLTFEIKRENVIAKVDVIRVVIGALGSYSKNVRT